MAELTQEQIKQASEAFRAAHGGSSGLLAAAPFLQLRLDEPTQEELQRFAHEYRNLGWTACDLTAARVALGALFERRNAALLPKPVDPRLEKIRSALVYHAAHRFNQLITPNQFDEAALAVLTALNEVK